VCHQTVSLAARTLEAAGIPTVVMGCAKDIVEHAGVPRFLFSDFPLGNPAGKPKDKASQTATLELALRLLPAAIGPRTTIQNPIRWNADGKWKLDYSNVDQLTPEEIARRREEFDRGKEVAKQRLAEDMKNKKSAAE
jgi:D-proline reductase (dithiol) PrdB